MGNADCISKNWNCKSLAVKVLFSRAGIAQQIRVAAETGAVLIDTGDGIIRDLRASGLSRDKINGIFFTHGHFDHMGGLHSLLGYMRMIGRRDDLPVIVPEGCEEVMTTIKNFVEIYGDTIPYKILLNEARPREIFEIGGMNIEAWPVVHCGSIEGEPVLDRIPAFGYRISHNGESVAISGDTGDCESLREMVKGADLAILEATYEKSSDATAEELANVHLSEESAAEIGALAKEFIMIHKGRR
jgi:ribonuclease BN (tRNA processing enzyme)